MPSKVPMTDRDFMLRAVELSRRGWPAPNPRVGCVLVRDGEIVGEGFHEFCGGPHAEVVALQMAGDRAQGATAFVTLEPCNHQGKTGPCSLALLAAKIARVVFAVADPNPKAEGGAQRLKAAGVLVESGLCEPEARAENEAWLSSFALGRPFVRAKVAMSLDGRMSLPGGESKWITSELARDVGRSLRAEMGVVLTGAGTVLQDDPHLTPRTEGVFRPPLRVVLDPRGMLTGKEHVFDESAPSVRYVEQPLHAFDRPMTVSHGHFDLTEVLADLMQLGYRGILVEAGPRLVRGFFQSHLIDALDIFLAPRILGEGPTWYEGPIKNPLNPVAPWVLVRTRPLNGDLHLELRPNRGPETV